MTERERPGTARRLRAALAAAALVAALAACGGGDDGGRAASTSSTVPTLTDAAAVALRTLPVALPDTQVGALVQQLCAAAATGNPATVLEDLRELPAMTPDVLAQTLNALGHGSETRCPSGVARAPRLLQDLYTGMTGTAAPPPPDASTAIIVPGGAVAGTDAGTDAGAGTPGTLVPPGAPGAGGTTATTARTTATAPLDTTATTRIGPVSGPTSTVAPTTTTPPIEPGDPCAPVGATGHTVTGFSETCSASGCGGAALDQPRWRATVC